MLGILAALICSCSDNVGGLTENSELSENPRTLPFHAPGGEAELSRLNVVTSTGAPVTRTLVMNKLVQPLIGSSAIRTAKVINGKVVNVSLSSQILSIDSTLSIVDLATGQMRQLSFVPVSQICEMKVVQRHIGQPESSFIIYRVPAIGKNCSSEESEVILSTMSGPVIGLPSDFRILAPFYERTGSLNSILTYEDGGIWLRDGNFELVRAVAQGHGEAFVLGYSFDNSILATKSGVYRVNRAGDISFNLYEQTTGNAVVGSTREGGSVYLAVNRGSGPTHLPQAGVAEVIRIDIDSTESAVTHNSYAERGRILEISSTPAELAVVFSQSSVQGSQQTLLLSGIGPNVKSLRVIEERPAGDQINILSSTTNSLYYSIVNTNTDSNILKRVRAGEASKELGNNAVLTTHEITPFEMFGYPDLSAPSNTFISVIDDSTKTLVVEKDLTGDSFVLKKGIPKDHDYLPLGFGNVGLGVVSSVDSPSSKSDIFRYDLGERSLEMVTNSPETAEYPVK